MRKIIKDLKDNKNTNHITAIYKKKRCKKIGTTIFEEKMVENSLKWNNWYQLKDAKVFINPRQSKYKQKYI